MSDTVFVTMYAPALGNVQVDAPLQAVSTYQSHGWLLLDPGATAPPVASPYLSQPAADSRYLRDWAGAEALTAGAVRVAPDGHVIVRVADGTTRSTYDGTEAALWTAIGGQTAAQLAADPALRAAFALPAQASNAGKFLTTDGTTASWGTPAGGGGTTLTVAATASADATLAAGKHTPADATSSARTMTLPTGAASGSLISVEKFDTSTNTVTLTGNIRGTPSASVVLVWAKEALLLVADSSGSWWPVAGHKTKTSLDWAYGRVVTPESYGAKGDDTADDTAALQAAFNAAQGQQNGVVQLTAKYKITDALSISRPVTIRGSHRSNTQIRQATAAKNGITLVRDVSTGQSFTRGVRIENVTLTGPGNGTSTAFGIGGFSGDENYQGQGLHLSGVTLTGWDIGLRLHRWDNCRYERLALEYSRIGLWIDGNANSHYINASATNCTEVAIKLGDGCGIVLDLDDLISCGQMITMLAGAQATIIGTNFESCTGSQSFVMVNNGASLAGQVGRAIKGIGNDVPVFLVDTGGSLSLLQFLATSGFTTSKPIKKATNNAIVTVLNSTGNLSAAAYALVDDNAGTTYPASLWPVRQENAIPAPSANLRNLLLGVMGRDAQNTRDRLLFGLKDKGTGSDRYTYADLTRIVTRDDGTATGSPEGVVYAPQGSIYCRDDPTDAYTAVYAKTTAKTLNTGWQPLASAAGGTGPTGPSGSREDDAANAAGVLAESVPLMAATSAGALTAGTIYGCLIGLKAGDVVTKLNAFVTTPAVGTAPTLVKMGIADASGVIVAVTANEASNAAWTLAGGGPVQLALTAPYTVPSTGGYRIVILQVGSWATTQASILRGAAVGNIQAQPIPGGLRRFGTHGGSQTDLPAVSASLPSVAGSNINLPWWMAASA